MYTTTVKCRIGHFGHANLLNSRGRCRNLRFEEKPRERFVNTSVILYIRSTSPNRVQPISSGRLWWWSHIYLILPIPSSVSRHRNIKTSFKSYPVAYLNSKNAAIAGYNSMLRESTAVTLSSKGKKRFLSVFWRSSHHPVSCTHNPNPGLTFCRSA
jgi:hypothetical protein